MCFMILNNDKKQGLLYIYIFAFDNYDLKHILKVQRVISHAENIRSFCLKIR